MGDGGADVAIEAKLNVAGQVVLNGGCASRTAHAKGRKGRAPARSNELDLAEGAVGGHDRAAHVFQHTSPSGQDGRQIHITVCGITKATLSIGRGPLGRRKRAAIDARVIA